jgi:hypothetical protein
VLIGGNVGYLWLKKEPQYRDRAAPTAALFSTLDSSQAIERPVRVCGFPFGNVWWFRDAVSRFTSVSPEDIQLTDDCGGGSGVTLTWNAADSSYVVVSPPTPSPASVIDAAIDK